jgi:YHS domain-containing protein
MNAHHRYNLLGESVAAGGYDPVSYFPEGGGGPVKGLIEISEEYGGVTYRFASERNRQAFRNAPERYQPQYGGWCAWAVGAVRKRVDIDPQSFEIRGDRLYLFYRDPKLDTRAMWLKDEQALIEKGNVNWPALSD